jgi:uncharacterized protein YndB with AHSA1/START domain
MMTMDDFAKKLDDRKIQFVRILPGPIEKIFAYLWDGEKRGEWFASGAMPTMPGERFEMRFKHSEFSPHKSVPPEKMKEMDEKGHGSVNTLIVYEPPYRLAFTFGSEKGRGISEVEFRLAQEGGLKDNKVRLTLTHSEIPDRGVMLGVSGGWHSHLDVLEYKAKGEIPPGFWDIWRRYDGIYDKRYG